jgi:NAD(P)H-hydrate epimerase
MQALPIDLYTADHTRALEQRVIEQLGISGGELMARAGKATLATIQHRWPLAKHLLIVCGMGNNGGDGYELARQAQEKGYQVTVLQIGDETKSSSTAQAARQAMLAHGISLEGVGDHLPKADIIVDAIFGIGLTRDVSGEFERIINIINTTVNIPVLALDCPSGLDVDTGRVRGTTIKATATISFLALNPGLFTGMGPDY